MITIFDAILAIKPDANITVQGNDFENIVWHDDNPENISKQQVQEKIEELEKVKDLLLKSEKVIEEANY